VNNPGSRPANAVVDQSRRRVLSWFLGTSVGGLLAAVLYPVIRFVIPPEVPEATTNQVEAGQVSDPEFREQGYKIVRFGADPVIVVRADEGDFRAFSATCTHLDCIVEYQKEHARIWCNCHNGEYDLHGKNVGGPPPKPLESYRVHLIEQGSGPATVVVSRT
jgi:Rieske Fe-S protein